jgi:hypothetical protein
LTQAQLQEPALAGELFEITEFARQDGFLPVGWSRRSPVGLLGFPLMRAVHRYQTERPRARAPAGTVFLCLYKSV